MNKIKQKIKKVILVSKLKLKYKNINLKINSNSFISTKAQIIMGNNSTIEIGENCYISDNTRLIVGKDSTLTIEDNVYISINSIISSNSVVKIKKDTVIAHNVTIIDTNKNYNKMGVSIREQGKSVEPIEIGENCWLSAGVVVLKGVKLGEQCVVAANSVVNRSFNKYKVIGGIPSKVIREIEKEYLNEN